jgi:modulator of FtsH protease HflC
MNRIVLLVVGALVALLVLGSTVFVVDQRKFAVVYSLGEIKEVIAEPGLHFKMPPPLQEVVFLDRPVQTLDSRETKSIFTAEKNQVVIDWLVKWRITDPKQFILNNGVKLSNVEGRLSPIVQAALNEEVTKRTVQAMLSTDRDGVMQGVRTRLADEAKSFGIEIVDVRIKRVDFPADAITAVYKKMAAEREQEAKELRATGEAEGQRIRAEAISRAEIIEAEAYAEAQKLMGEGDAKAAAIYSEAFGRDPQFAQFYRSLEAYRASFKNKNDVMVLDPSSDFFKAMRGTGGGAAPASKK